VLHAPTQKGIDTGGSLRVVTSLLTETLS